MGKTLSKVRSAGIATSKPNGKTLHKVQVSYSTKKVNKVNDKEVTGQVDKIMSALNEANEIHAGRKKGTSLDKFLREI